MKNDQARCQLANKRKGLARFNRKLSQSGPATVAFLGGSITEGFGATDPDRSSWRALTETYLRTRFPHISFRFINAGVGGTDSAFGAHRLSEHALAENEVDLLLVEFAVNDGEDRDRSIRGMEGIVRQCKRLSPQADLLFLYTAADKNFFEGMPFTIAVHEEVADHYGIPSVNFAAGIRALIREGRTRWEEVAPDRTHPNDAGYALYAGFLKEFLEEELTGIGGFSGMRDGYWELPAPMNPDNYEFGSLIEFDQIERKSGFQFRELEAEPLINWRFPATHLFTDTPGAELAFTVCGRGAGLLMLCGPDSGIFDFSLNGGSYQSVNPFDDWCLYAYRPVISLLPELEVNGSLQVIIRNTDRKDARSTGTALRIMKLLSH